MPGYVPLTKCSFIVKLTHRIEMRSTKTQGTRKEHRDSEYFHKTFPYFIWLLRDVTQAIPTDCRNIKEYFLKKVKFPISNAEKRKYVSDQLDDDLIVTNNGFSDARTINQAFFQLLV